MCEPLCVRDCFFSFTEPDEAILKVIGAPCAESRGIFCLTSAISSARRGSIDSGEQSSL